jgi:ABC-type spermidine/putrescine transport system permease subunit II
MLDAILYLYAPLFVLMSFVYATGLRQTAMKITSKPIFSDWALLFQRNGRIKEALQSVDLSVFTLGVYRGNRDIAVRYAYEEIVSRKRWLRGHFVPFILATVCALLKAQWGVEVMLGVWGYGFAGVLILGAVCMVVGTLSSR